MKTRLFVLLAMLLAASVHGESFPEPQAQALLQAIRNVLPEGWKVVYAKQDSWLEITREQSVLATSALPNSAPDEKAQPKEFSFSYRMLKFISPAEHRRLSAENHQIQAQANVLYQSLVSRKVSHKFDSFLPTREEDKKDVARYEALQKSLHQLPEYFFANISLSSVANSLATPSLSIQNAEQRDECDAVREMVNKVFTEY